MNTGKRSILLKGKGRTRKQAQLKYIYQKESMYFAQIAEGINDIVIEEFKDLGAFDLKPVFRGLWFKASKKDFYRINYFSRLASRILTPLVSFECNDKDDLYKAAKKIHWEDFLTPKKTFSIAANVSESNITHSNFAGLRVKDAIADYFRDRTGKRPDVDPKNPYITINLHLHKNLASISIDASGGPLHKRGYREETISSPMQETVAAAIINLSGWDGTIPLYDPMCGSGTFLCEALMKYGRIPSQIFRTRFGLERLPDFNAALWKKIMDDSRDNFRKPEKGMISGSDVSQISVDAAKTNIMGLHFGSEIIVEQKDFHDIKSLDNTLIVANPPYGIRMGKDKDLDSFYHDFGLFLKNRCKKSTAFVYFGEPKYIKKFPLAPAWKRPLRMGGLPGKLVKYDLY